MTGQISFTIPIKTPSAANLREHWGAKAERTKSQRNSAMLRCPRWEGPALLIIRLTRASPRPLDDDNLRLALKATRDGIASRLKIDDGSPLVKWEYEQIQRPAGQENVYVTIQVAHG